MINLEEKIYPAVTGFLIFTALFATASPFLPIMGALNGLAMLLLLTLKMIVGKTLAKTPASGLVKGEVKKAVGEKMAGKAAESAASKAAATTAKSAASKANFWAMVIEYFIAPMNETEKLFLLLGWAVFPVAMLLQIAVIVAMIQQICTLGGNTPDFCDYLPIKDLINLFL